jgi:uncharacterized protein with FMN-binding domain
MRRIVIISLTTVVAVTLLFSYHTSTNTAAVPVPAAIRQRGSSGSHQSTPTAAVSVPPTTRQRGSSGAGSATFTGEVADTRWGPVQVRITVQGGKITASEAVQHPQESRRDVQINDYALPILGRETVEGQSASIDTVSGATVTSDGYVKSLQSAIDQAHL